MNTKPSFAAFAPGRVELLGNHTDYNGGVVLSAALDLGITASGTISADGGIRLRSSCEKGVLELAPGTPATPNATWADYPLGVYETLRKAGYPVRGFEATFDATLPGGAGLSSSAALEVSTALLLTRLFGFTVPPMELAELCRRAENDFVGVNCGLLDQVSSVFGKRDHAVFLDCRTKTVERIPLRRNCALVIIHSGVRHALTGGEYNERRDECFEAARRLGVSQLRDVDSTRLGAANLPDVLFRRAVHVVGENERVFAAVQALKADDMETVGRLMTESHASSRVNFENSTPELDLLVELAMERSGVFGARLTGGGFGGAVVMLVPEPQAEAAASAVTQKYAAKTGHTATAYHCRAGDGAVR